MIDPRWANRRFVLAPLSFYSGCYVLLLSELAVRGIQIDGHTRPITQRAIVRMLLDEQV